MRDFEVLIIGGGPAGSSAAINLCKMGFYVCLAEKKSFPRETLCGEFLSGEVINNLDKLNLSEEFLSLHPNQIRTFRLFNKNGRSISAQLPFPAYGMRRSVFDRFLLNAAAREGAEVIQPGEVKTISGSPVKGFITKVLYGGSEIMVKSDVVIAAYGRQNILDKELGRNFAGRKTGLNGLKFHVEKHNLIDFPPDEIQIYTAENIYCGINLVDNNTATLCFLEDRNQYTLSARAHLYELLKINKMFNKKFPADFEVTLKELPAYGTGNIFFGKRNLTQNGIFMTGDSAGVIAPLAGDGIGMALDSSRILAEVLLLKKNQKINLNEAESSYKERWNKAFRRRLLTAKFIQKIILKERLNFGTSLIGRIPGVINYFVHATRN